MNTVPFATALEIKLWMYECMPDKSITQTLIKDTLYPYINLAPNFFLHPSIKISLEGEDTSVFLS